MTFSHDSVAFLQRGDSSVGLKEGNVITLDQAMHAMLLASANEAAYAIGESVGVNAGHDYNWFIEQMNSDARNWAVRIPILLIQMDCMIRIITHVQEIWR